MDEILYATGHGAGIEFTRQQSPQLVQCQQGAAHGVFRRLGRPLGATHRAHRHASGFHALGAHPVRHFLVQLAQAHTHLAGGQGHDAGARRIVGDVLREALAQGVYKRFRLERIQMRLHRDPTQQATDQRIELGQHVVHRQHDLLLRKRKFDVRVDLVFFQKLEIIKAHQGLCDLALGIAAVDHLAQGLSKHRFHAGGLGQQGLYRLARGAVHRQRRMLALGRFQRRLQAGQHGVHQGVALLQHRFKAALQGRFQASWVIRHSKAA